MMVRLPPLHAVKAATGKLVLLLALLWQAGSASAMAWMGCCLDPQPCCVAALVASPCTACAPVAMIGASPNVPVTLPPRVAMAVELHIRRWVEPVDDVWRPPIAQRSAKHSAQHVNVSINP
jgi:hypothetical protein